MLDDARPVPLLAIGVDLTRLDEMLAVLAPLVAAGVDGAIVAATMDADDEPGGADELARLRAALGGGAILLHGPLALARRAGVGVLLPERGIATAEARRLLGSSLPAARLVGSAAAATAARGADLIVIDRSASGGLMEVRRIVTASWEPALAWCEPTAAAARARFAAGCEGIVIEWDALDPRAPDASLAALAGALPAAATLALAAPSPITLDGVTMEVESDTTIADLLADAGLPDDVVVRVNGVRLARRRYDETVVRPGDVVETG